MTRTNGWCEDCKRSKCICAMMTDLDHMGQEAVDGRVDTKPKKKVGKKGKEDRT
jgi:hypothetical protein